MTELSSERLVEVITELADDKKAINIVELAVRDAVGYADYFLICSGNTERQVKAIHDGIHQGLKDDHGLLPRRVEGLTESRWVLMDYLDVVVHVFRPARGRRARRTAMTSSRRTCGTPSGPGSAR